MKKKFKLTKYTAKRLAAVAAANKKNRISAKSRLLKIHTDITNADHRADALLDFLPTASQAKLNHELKELKESLRKAMSEIKEGLK